MKEMYQNRSSSFNSFISVNNTYPQHLHEHVEMLMVIDGEIEANIADKNYNMQKGDIYIVFPNIRHSLVTKDKSKVHIIIADSGYYEDYMNEFRNFEPVNPVINSRMYPKELTDIFAKIMEHKEDKRIAKGYIIAAIGIILEYMDINRKDTITDSAVIVKCLDYIDNNFTKDIKLQDVAKIAGVSKYYVSRIFSDNLNCNIRTYINKRRVELARHMLSDSDKTVMEIGYMCGFDTPRTFYRAFKKETLMTPKEYKRQFFLTNKG